MAKNSFGGGYGLNRHLKAASHHAAAKPPMGNPSVKPGVGKAHHSNVSFSKHCEGRGPGTHIGYTATGRGVLGKPAKQNMAPPKTFVYK